MLQVGSTVPRQYPDSAPPVPLQYPTVPLQCPYSVPTVQCRRGSRPALAPLLPSAPAGKLHKGGVPDRDGVARTVLYDWQRAKIPWFTTPPFEVRRIVFRRSRTHTLPGAGCLWPQSPL